MDNKTTLEHYDIERLVQEMANRIEEDWSTLVGRPLRIYPVPRGGIPVAYMLLRHFPKAQIWNIPGTADLVVDDLIDSGATVLRYREAFPHRPFYALVNKKTSAWAGKWIVFPWEQSETQDQSADDIVLRLLQYIGEDPTREGLLETPQRVVKAWKHWTSGYGKKPVDVLKVFSNEQYDEMIWENNLPFYSQCEHHLVPFFGTATIAYIPGDKVCGISKLHRVLDMFARRLQMQERLTVQVADALMEVLQPKGVGVLLKARHLCKESRGISVQGTYTTTSALRGVFFDKPEVRSEFMSIASK